MTRPTYIALKIIVWLACLWPLCWLIWRAATNNLGADPTATITFATGLATLRILTISLAITPLRRLRCQRNGRRYRQAPLHHHGRRRVAAAAAVGRDLDQLGYSKAGRRALAQYTQAGLRRSSLRSDSLLVAGQARRAHAADDYDCAGSVADCASYPGMDATQQGANGLRTFPYSNRSAACATGR